MITVITGQKCTGKSTALIKVVNDMKARNKIVGGIVSPRIWKNGERLGYDMIDLEDSSSQILAIEAEIPDESYKFCTFSFRKVALDAGNAAIIKALEADLLIVDELGNWELEGGGWAASMPLVAKRKGHTILSIRDGVADKILANWGMAATNILRIDSGYADSILKELLHILK